MTVPTKTRVLVVAAMALELRPFVRSLRLRRDPGPPAVHRGRLAGTALDIVAATVGIGPTGAAAATERLLDHHGADRVVMLGIAGALDPSLAIGDLVVPEVVVDAATGARYHPRPAQGPVPAGIISTSADIQLDPSLLEELRRQGVVALDMETAAVGRVAEGRHLPWSAFRAVSDRVGDGLVDAGTLAMTKPDGRADVGAAFRAIARHPTMVPRLLRLAGDTHRAVGSAVAAAVAECRALGSVAGP